jgi:hypothetical protein
MSRVLASLLKQFFDRFVACAALSVDAATCVDLVGRSCAARDGAANLRFIEPIADADNHERPRFRTRTEEMAYMRMIVNIVESSSS